MNDHPRLPHDESYDDALYADLSRAASAPDMTRAIMGRLGYMKVSPAVARRQRIRQWINRSGILLAAALALSVGWKIYERGPTVRQPAGLTLPAALGSDLDRQHRRLGNVIQTIRNLSPKIDSATPPAQNPREETDGPPTLHEDVNRSSIAPVRWV